MTQIFDSSARASLFNGEEEIYPYCSQICSSHLTKGPHCMHQTVFTASLQCFICEYHLLSSTGVFPYCHSNPISNRGTQGQTTKREPQTSQKRLGSNPTGLQIPSLKSHCLETMKPDSCNKSLISGPSAQRTQLDQNGPFWPGLYLASFLLPACCSLCSGTDESPRLGAQPYSTLSNHITQPLHLLLHTNSINPHRDVCACVRCFPVILCHSRWLSVLIGGTSTVNIYLKHWQKIAVTETSLQSEAVIQSLISVILPSFTYD